MSNNNYELGKRRFVIGGLIMSIFLLYVIRLFNLQILDETYKQKARDNAFLTKTIYPARGEIRDRNDSLLVYNQPSYDLVVTMRDVKGLDSLDLRLALGMEAKQFEDRFRDIKDRARNPGYSPYTQQVFQTQLSVEDYARLQQRMYKYNGFEIRPRTIRQYMSSHAPHILGNIREVTKKEIEREDYYRLGDYIGGLGVEQTYEKYLRGVKGKEILLRDAHGRIKGRYEDGKYDQEPVAGRNIKLSIDIDLQAYAESLMVNKVGALVAIEPATGEVLALVSSPTFDPTTLVGRQKNKNYAELYKDPYKPLLNRAIQGAYPPGSTFKPTQGLIGLQEEVITETTLLNCSGGFVLGSFRMGCHDGYASWSIEPAISGSCNGYFGWCLMRILNNRKKYKNIQESFEAWKNYMVSMGYGYPLGIDLPGEKRGFIPNPAYYNKAMGREDWTPVSVISISIGQGEILATPLQIANLAATIANRGYYYIPHVVHEIQDTLIPDTFRVKRHTMIDEKYYKWIVNGMRRAVTGGTVTRTGNLDPEGIKMCGKTGTAQNPHGKDHSVFMGFAPMDEPKIAVACYVENGGFGATFGVPIGSLVIEKYLNGKISARRKGLEESMRHTSTMGNMGYMKRQQQKKEEQ